MATHERVTQSPGLPPQLVLYQMATGHYISGALHLVAKLGLADLLKDGPRHYGELAQATTTNAAALNRVMRLLASVGIFEEQENGRFALTPLGVPLRAGVPGSMRASVMLFAGTRIQDSWKDLEYCVQTGEPAYRRRGVTDPFDDLMRGPIARQPSCSSTVQRCWSGREAEKISRMRSGPTSKSYMRATTRQRFGGGIFARSTSSIAGELSSPTQVIPL